MFMNIKLYLNIILIKYFIVRNILIKILKIYLHFILYINYINIRKL